MSLETTLSRIADALERIAAGIEPVKDGTVITAYPPDQVPQQTPEPEAAPTQEPAAVTIDQLRERFHALSQQGRRDDLLALLAQFQVQRLPDLPPQHYGDVAERLRAMEAA